MNIIQKLEERIKKVNSLICVGLDSALEKIPSHLQSERYPQFTFNKAIIDATAPFVCAYKPNSAFYEAAGEAGMKELKMTFDYIQNTYPEIVTILDAKRADIGSTNEGYINFIFRYLGADAVTINPYPGREALKPLLEQKDKGIIVWCKASNPGSGEFQNLLVDGQELYKIIAKNVVNEWNKNGNCLLVVGATYPKELGEVRKIAGDMTFLIPGIGAQGGDVGATVKAGLNSKNTGMIINSSRGIIFASKGTDFAKRAGEEAKKLKEEINKYRE